jgi:ribosomal protein S18 acetylase RimI-like enzyme
MTDIAAIEHVAANALPSPIFRWHQGWRFRYAYGVTRRANSVLAEQHIGDLEENIKAAEAFYAEHHSQPRFQLCPASQPDNLETVLLEKGYQKIPGAFVQTLLLNAFKAKKHSTATTLLEKPDSEWFSVYHAVTKTSPEKEKVRTWMLEHTQPKAAFALFRIDTRAVAVGLGVLEKGYVGIFNMATLEDFRGCGAASSILSELVTWAQDHKAHTAYLQVAHENTAAQSIYKHFGFDDFYTYTYLEKS